MSFVNKSWLGNRKLTHRGMTLKWIFERPLLGITGSRRRSWVIQAAERATGVSLAQTVHS